MLLFSQSNSNSTLSTSVRDSNRGLGLRPYILFVCVKDNSVLYSLLVFTIGACIIAQQCFAVLCYVAN